MSSRNASIQPLVNQLPKGFAHLWTKKRIVDPALGFMSIKIGRLAGQDHRHPVGKQFSCMGKSAHQRSLWSNLGPGAGLPLGR